MNDTNDVYATLARAQEELKSLRNLAIAVIFGIRNAPTLGTQAFDAMEECINEWYAEYGCHDPYVVAEVEGQ
jgi:hypothetical protein